MLLDREAIREQRKEKVARFLKYFGVIMAIFYFMAGLAVLLWPVIENLSGTMRYLVSALFFLYGAFRLYRSLRK